MCVVKTSIIYKGFNLWKNNILHHFFKLSQEAKRSLIYVNSSNECQLTQTVFRNFFFLRCCNSLHFSYIIILLFKYYTIIYRIIQHQIRIRSL